MNLILSILEDAADAISWYSLPLVFFLVLLHNALL